MYDDTDALRDVLAEREAQDEKWGVQDHSLTQWMPILGEEFGELCRAVLNADTFAKNASAKQRWVVEARSEAVQVAAVALAIVECIDRQLEER
jgi:hypothetical protein